MDRKGLIGKIQAMPVKCKQVRCEIHICLPGSYYICNHLFSEEEKESAKSHQTSVYDNTLDNQLPGVSLTVRTQIRQKLQGKDDTIRQLRAENDELRAHIKTLSEENHQNKERLVKLDRVRSRIKFVVNFTVCVED